ncbi:MAG: YceI family protein [Actinomycetota bacterium]|nr:YceI family protein [Actinomycetota bacterium]
MRLLTKLLAAAVVFVALAGAGLWYFVLRSDAAPRARIDQTTTVPGRALAGIFVLARGDARSFVGYRVQEQFAGTPIESTATGRTHDVAAKLTIDGTTVATITADADLTTLHSDRAARDHAITTSGLESNKFPQARFVLTEPIRFGRPPKLGQAITTTATGDFTLHGITRQVHVPLQGRWDGKTIQVVGHLPIAFADYHLDAPSIAGFVSVKDHGEMEFQLFLKPAGTN